jgi:hypothetical protein
VGAYGADNVMFLGKLRSPRFYTELFMTAKSYSPPPPPSGGGGGGGSGGSTGGGGSPVTSPVASAPAPHHRTASAQRVEAPAAPRASSPLGDATLVAALPGQSVPAAAAAALVERPGMSDVATVPVAPAGGMRIQAAEAPVRGVFETVLSSLLGFVF